MGKRLGDNLNAQYLGAAHRLKPRHARRCVVAYVESYDDVYFWRTVLSQVETPEVFFEIMLPTRGSHLSRGKKAALLELLDGKTGQDLIACVDADYDYLLQGKTASSAEVCQNPYVFHTYAYAIENLLCYAPTLHSVAVAATLNDARVAEPEAYLTEFSHIIYPLFIWHFWFFAKGKPKLFTITDFLHAISVEWESMRRLRQSFHLLQAKVNQQLAELERSYPEASQSWEQVRRKLLSLGVNEDNVYMYIQGHHLMDRVVLPFMGQMTERMVRNRETEIARQSIHRQQRQNELSCYRASTTDVRSILRKNPGATLSPQAQQLLADLRYYVRQLVANPQESRIKHT